MNTQRPEIRKGRKYDQVLAGAREVFLRDGFEGASVDDIARAAKVSKATLYSYFPDKRHMFMEMAREQCARQAEVMLQEIDRTAPATKILAQTARGVLQLILSEFGLKVFRICVAEADRFPELGRRFYETGPAMGRQHLAAYLREATSRNELKIDNFELAAAQFQELCKADLYLRLVFGINVSFTEDEIETVVQEAVSTFMARYGA
ncbi:transcriptional regulator, TetR family [Shimia gijangensis]|uniref:Transcriptional regulator, TetR family n=1 Tax=Shimia gijangensis TaxID=1470563 RepID=A0A1M6JJ21_9RHOB|nr:TetR/AcrR family transcriptional regulator [Shimia gijangensis]SHJ46605.1 transcriptional regulator, TetR family [Shimia gijangensis]